MLHLHTTARNRYLVSGGMLISDDQSTDFALSVCAHLAEAILDRIKHDVYMINIIPTDPGNASSMKEAYGLNLALSK